LVTDTDWLKSLCDRADVPHKYAVDEKMKLEDNLEVHRNMHQQLITPHPNLK
jgi:hypothetical protein